VAACEYDALALLIVRLDSADPPSHGLRWHRWEEAIGEQHGLPSDIASNSTSKAPFKRTPGNNGWGYFNSHVERVLFPRSDESGNRLLCCPEGVSVDFAAERGGPRRRARVDLLERITSPIDNGSTLGLIHLALLPSDNPGAPSTLKWSRAVTSLYRQRFDRFVLELVRGDERVALPGRNPIRELVGALLGDPHAELERSLYSVVMARCPTECRDDSEHERDWRRALAKRRLDGRPRPGDADESEREHRQTIRLAGATGLLLDRQAVFSLSAPIDGEYARNLRSYWSESLVFGLLQQSTLEEFQRRLAAIGDPLSPSVQPLRRDWLRFRNLLWWSQLSGNTDVPQELLARIHHELGTKEFFTDLEGDLATYSEQQQAATLANLQIYGAPFVVFGTLITAISLFNPSRAAALLLVVVVFLLALGAMLFVRDKLASGGTG
jgi:hypothetical protein